MTRVHQSPNATDVESLKYSLLPLNSLYQPLKTKIEISAFQKLYIKLAELYVTNHYPIL